MNIGSMHLGRIPNCSELPDIGVRQHVPRSGRHMLPRVPACGVLHTHVESGRRWRNWWPWMLPRIRVCVCARARVCDQFNNIKPSDIKSHFSQDSQWLTKRKRWRMEETTWSVHKECKRLDRAGQGNSTKFWYITHEGLVETVEWEMSNNTYIISAGKLWTRQDCIPMGGSFSAQSANLHSLWSVYTHRHLFRQLGTLKIAEQGFIYWENARGKVSLQHFRDNILIASTYPNSPETALVHTVRGILQQAGV